MDRDGWMEAEGEGAVEGTLKGQRGEHGVEWRGWRWILSERKRGRGR